VAQNLNISSATKIILAGGAQANNIFWAVAGQTTLGTTSVFNGNILDQTTIVLNTGATLNGRALAQAAVTLDSSSVTTPTSVTSATPAVPATPAVSATPASVTSTSVTSATPAVSATAATPATPALTSKQQQQYDLFISVGASHVSALNAVNQMPASTPTPSTSSSVSASTFGQQVRAIAINLGSGSKNNDVATLQQFLISQGKGPAAQVLAQTGATSYFGSLTRAALAEFQAKVGITPSLGNFGSITRAYLKANY
jgi:murein L,D-transpeptidase YcbB/YkuD